MTDPAYRARITEIANDPNLSTNRKRVEAGKFMRQTAMRLSGEGKTTAEIAEITGMKESTIRTLLLIKTAQGES